MTPEQRAAIKLSEVREKLNTLANADDLTDEQRADLEKASNEYADREQQYRAALMAAGERDSRDEPARDNLGQLAARAEVRSYLQEVANGDPVTGASAELRQEAGLGAHSIPWAALMPSEHRAADDVVSPVPSGSRDVMAHSILARVFAASDTQYLGVSMPMVGAGESRYNVLTAGVTAAPRAADAAFNAAAATFTPTTLAPIRLTARYLFRVEDLAVLPGTEEALRMDLRGALTDAMDNQILNGNGTAPNVSGLFQSLTNPTAAGSSENTFVQFLAKLNGGVDGIYARSLADIRALIGVETYATYSALYVSGGDSDAIDRVQGKAGGLRVSSRIPAAASNVQAGLLYRAGMGDGHAVAPVWEGVRLIRDEYSDARTGQVSITALMLWNFSVLRTAAYSEISLRIP